MRCDSAFKDPKDAELILEKLSGLTRAAGSVRLMEVCGTHTMSIARTGLKSLLPPEISLLSGPGCPVCVTPAGAMDAIFSLAEDPRILIASYGDLLRVPGTRRGNSLFSLKATGARVESVYSPVDALQLAAAHPELEVVFLGVGFETTAPGTAACILEAASRNLSNFSVLCLLKRTEPALRSLIEADDFNVNGFLCPGHVATVIGCRRLFLPAQRLRASCGDRRLRSCGSFIFRSGSDADARKGQPCAEERICPGGAPRREPRRREVDGSRLFSLRRLLERAGHSFGRRVFHPRRIRLLGCRPKVRLFFRRWRRAPRLSLRPGDPRRDGACGLRAVRQSLHASGSGGALHGFLRRRLCGSIPVSADPFMKGNIPQGRFSTTERSSNEHG